MRKTLTVLILLAMIPILSANVISVIEMDGMIAGGFLSYLERELNNAEKSGFSACIILLNTPGGLVDTTIKMNELILNANIPVIVFVYPSGGMAASAGAFIVLASDIAVMAPVTTIGSAQPIAITPEGTNDAGEKTRKFLSRQAKSLAENKNRPVNIANDFVEHNLALTAGEALDHGIVEYIASGIEDLMQQLDGVEIEKNGVIYVFSKDDYQLQYPQLTLQESFQQWISNPQISMLFLMLGLMGLYVGFSSPGTLVPEVLGGILLLLGVYGIGLFETNIMGIILLLTGLSLIIAEFFTSGFGILGIGGILTLVIGALMIPVEPLMGVDWYGTFIRTVIGVGIAVGIILAVVLQRVINSLRNPPTSLTNLDLPETAVVVERLNPKGMVKAKGELWNAISDNNVEIDKNKEVFIIGKKDSYLMVTEDKTNIDRNN